MARDVVYTMLVSLDGYMEGPDGTFGWATPDAEVHAFFNDLARASGAFLYGRRMYEEMAAFWPTAGDDPRAPAEILDFASVWQAKEKVVFSRTLTAVGSNTRLVSGDAVAEVRRLKAQDGGPLDVGGAALAGSLLQAGLVDEVGLVVCPVLVGGGKRALPALEAVRPLRRVETRAFAGGATYLRYRCV